MNALEESMKKLHANPPKPPTFAVFWQFEGHEPHSFTFKTKAEADGYAEHIGQQGAKVWR